MANEDLKVITKAKQLAKHTLIVHHYVTDEGKYIRKLRGDRKRNTQKKVRRWVRAVNEEKMPMKKFNEKYGACRNHMLHGNCIKLCHSMDFEIERRMK